MHLGCRTWPEPCRNALHRCCVSRSRIRLISKFVVICDNSGLSKRSAIVVNRQQVTCKLTGCSSLQPASTLRELACHTGWLMQYYLPPGRCDIPVFTPSQIELILDLATPEGCKAPDVMADIVNTDCVHIR